MHRAPSAELLLQYAHYHRDPRNIATHFVGIPMIVFGVSVLLARLEWNVAGITIDAAWLAWAATAAWYLRRGLLPLALATTAVIGLLGGLAQLAAAGSTASWLGWGVGTFVVGWALQFAGHFWEGRKPAFLDDMRGLLVGPMFVVAEVMFALGWGAQLHEHIVRQAGPVRRRGVPLPAA
jgi:uncharacterized membrane protein YGL010W